MTCKRCGYCCMNLDICLTPAEVADIQTGLLNWPLTVSMVGHYILKPDDQDGGCPFLDRETKLCTRYHVQRPVACSEYHCKGR